MNRKYLDAIDRCICTCGCTFKAHGKNDGSSSFGCKDHRCTKMRERAKAEENIA